MNKKKKADSVYDYEPKKQNHSFGNDFKEELTNNIIGGFILFFVDIVFFENYENEDNLHNPISVYPYKDALNGNYTRPRSQNIHKNIRFDIEEL